MIARSVQKAAAVENSSLIMGLGSHRPRRTRTAEGSLHGGGGGGGCERITFRSFLPLGARWTYTDGRRRVRQREERGGERERTKLSTPDKNVERKERRLASNTNTTSASEGGVEEGG